MTNARRAVAAAVIGLAGPLASPAFGKTTLKNVMDWPGTHRVLGYFGNLTRLGGEFYGTAVQQVSHPTPYTAIFRMTPPSGAQLKWHTKIIYDFALQDMTHPGEVYNAYSPIYFDNEHRLYGIAQHRCDHRYYCEVLYTLQPPASGGGAWTRNIVWNYENDTRITSSSDVTFDDKGNLYGSGGDANKDCRTDENACGGIYELTPNSAHTSWAFSLLYKESTLAELSRPVLDKSGNIFTIYTPAYGNPAAYSIIEISPPAVSGGIWTHEVIWRPKTGQIPTLIGILVGPDGNLIVTARGTEGSGDGAFKLLRPATQTDKWSYTPIWQGVSDGGNGVGYGPSTPIIDKDGVVFYEGFRDVVSLTPPDSLGHPWVAKEVFRKTGYRDYYFNGLTSDAAGDLLFNGVFGQVYELKGSGFVPQHSTKQM